MSRIAVEQPGIVNDKIGAAPLALLPVGRIHAPLDRYLGSACQGWCCTWRDLVFRIQSNQVRRVPVIWFSIFQVFQPFLQLSVAAYLERRQLGPRVFKFFSKLVVCRQNLCSLDTHAVKRIHKDAVTRIAHGFGAMSAIGCEIPVFR